MDLDTDLGLAAREWVALVAREWEVLTDREWAARTDRWAVDHGDRLRRREEEAAGAA